MAVMKGYKQTEAGEIPNDWSAVPIGELLNFQGGSQPDKSFFRQTWKPGYIRLIQIRDYKTDQFITYIPRVLARRFCTTEDIMIGRYGPPIFQILRGIEGAYNVALIKAIVQPNVLQAFCYYFLKRDTLFQFIEKLSQRSSGQTGVDLVELKKYPIPLPPTLTEQEAIAGALSDADAWIESLEQLIAKKRQIKQGAMQELLTGKRRLPGFSGKWKAKRLGELGSFYSGGTPNTSIPEYYGGDIAWITSSDCNSGCIRSVAGRLTPAGVANSATKWVVPGTVLMALYGATAGVVAISKIDATINQAVLAMKLDSQDSSFMFQKLSMMKDWIIQTYTQGGQPNLSGAIVKSVELESPAYDEQVAIATVLSEMDTEIESLESKLAKAREIKQGMMQELLTGRIRLIEN